MNREHLTNNTDVYTVFYLRVCTALDYTVATDYLLSIRGVTDYISLSCDMQTPNMGGTATVAAASPIYTAGDDHDYDTCVRCNSNVTPTAWRERGSVSSYHAEFLEEIRQ